MAEEANNPATQQVPVVMDVTKMHTAYCNFFRVSLSGSTEEILMDVGLHSGIMGTGGMEPILFSHRIVMNPYVAKRLIESLRQMVVRYEQAFGVLELDANRRLRGAAN